MSAIEPSATKDETSAGSSLTAVAGSSETDDAFYGWLGTIEKTTLDPATNALTLLDDVRMTGWSGVISAGVIEEISGIACNWDLTNGPDPWFQGSVHKHIYEFWPPAVSALRIELARLCIAIGFQPPDSGATILVANVVDRMAELVELVWSEDLQTWFEELEELEELEAAERATE